MNARRLAHLLGLFSLWLGLVSAAFAHDVGLSSATVQLQTNRLQALLTFAAREMDEIVPLDLDQNGVVSPDEFALARESLGLALTTNCFVRFDETAARLGGIHCQLDSSNNVDLRFSCELPKYQQLELDFSVICLLAPGHRMFFTLLTPAGDTIAERLLSQNSPVVKIQLDAETPETKPAPPAPPSALPTFTGFLKLGVEHILVGYDHLLFLLALLIVTRNPMSALKVVTCFTLAHSITLAVATLDLVAVPRTVVEPLVALTIVYVGLENVWKHGDPHKRWLLTFAFGLIHGFGFASVLRELGVGARGGVAMPLFSFNLGVELGQIVVAALALPIIWQLRKNEKFLRYGVPAGSVVVALLGAFWFVQRVWLK